jgi:hypothetical protein
LRSAADACGSEGGTGAESDEHAATTIAMARIPVLTDTAPLHHDDDIRRQSRDRAGFLADSAVIARCGTSWGR